MVQENGKEIGVFKHVDNFMRTVANFATFGLADAAAGTLNAKLLNSSCKTALLCVDEEIRRSNRMPYETPITYAVGNGVGVFLMTRIPGLAPTAAMAHPVEHVFSLAALDFFTNRFLKDKVEAEIVLDPPFPDSAPATPMELLRRDLLR